MDEVKPSGLDLAGRLQRVDRGVEALRREPARGPGKGGFDGGLPSPVHRESLAHESVYPRTIFPCPRRGVFRGEGSLERLSLCLPRSCLGPRLQQAGAGLLQRGRRGAELRGVRLVALGQRVFSLGSGHNVLLEPCHFGLCLIGPPFRRLQAFACPAFLSFEGFDPA